jgi:hypothetical protein
MADELEGSAPSGKRSGEAAKPKPVNARKSPATKPKRKAEPPTITDDLTGKFLRVGNKLYRTSDDKTPIVRIANRPAQDQQYRRPSRHIRIAKANGWTSIRSTAATSSRRQPSSPLPRKGWQSRITPSKIVLAEAERLQARIAEREKRREGKKPNSKSSEAANETITFKSLSDRFLKQSHEENARDPELRRAQSLVAQTISITRAKYPDDPVKASKEVTAMVDRGETPQRREFQKIT